MRRRTTKEVPKTHRRNKVDSVESEQEPVETPSNKPNVSISTVVRMKQLAKRQASTRELKGATGESQTRHVHRSTTPEITPGVPSTRSITVQPNASQDTANLNKELWKVRDQLAGLQLVVNGIPNKNTLMKDILSKLPKPADPVEPLDIEAVKKEVTETVTKVVMDSLPKPADPVEPLDVDAVKKEVTETVTKTLMDKIPQPADPVEPLDVDAVKKEVTEAVTKTLMDKIPQPADPVEPLDVDAVKKEITETVTKALLKKIPQPADPVEPLDVEAVKKEVTEAVTKTLMDSLPNPVEPLDVDAVKKEVTETVTKTLMDKIPQPADPVEPLDVDAVKKEVTEAVTKTLMDKIPQPADPVEPLDVEAVKKEITETVTKALLKKIPQPADPVEPLDVEAVKKEVTEAVTKTLMDSLPNPVEPLDVEAVKKDITETVTKVVMESLPKPADPVEPLDVEAVKKEVTETVTKVVMDSLPKPVEPLDVDAVKNTILTSAKQDSVAGITLLREDLMRRIQELTNKVEALTHIPSNKPSSGESMMDRLLGVENEIRTLCLRIDEIGKNKIVIEPGKSPSSYSRTRERKDVDSHRLSRLPMFAVELAEDMVIEGGTRVYPLIRTPEWIVSKDSENTFHMENGYYVAPFPGNYNVFTLLKTVSTSVTAHISVEHRDKRGSIRKVYAIDQSSLTDESTGQVMLMDVNTNDQIAIMIQTRFNMKLVGSKMLLQEETGKEYPEIYNMVQITYSPHRGFCEVSPTEEGDSV